MKHFDTCGNLVRETHEPMKERNIKAKVLKACTVNNLPAKPGDIVLVCADTFRNAGNAGLLGPEDAKLPEPPKPAK